MNKNLIKAVYEYSKKTGNTALEKDIDEFVKKNRLYVTENSQTNSQKSSVNISESISKILDNHGILNENGMIIETKNLITESSDILPYLKKCGKRSKKTFESAISLINKYSIQFEDKNVIFKNNLKDLNEALSYMEHRYSHKVNEGLEDLSDLPIREGQYEFDNYEDFMTTFDDQWLSEHREEFNELALWFNNGGSIVMNIYPDENTLTGYNVSLSWSNGESTINDHQKINSLTKKYITDEIAGSLINESEEEEDNDDFDMKEYYLGDKNTPSGVYQIIESDNDDFTPFDLVEVISRTDEEVVIKMTDGEEKTYTVKELETVEGILYKDYDAVLECLSEDTVVGYAGITMEDLSNLVLNNNIKYEEVTGMINDMMSDSELSIVTPQGEILHCVNGKFIREYVDEFGNTDINETSEENVVAFVVMYLVNLHKEKNSIKPADFGYECKYDTGKTYAAVIASQDRISADELASFVEDWNEIVKLSDAGDPNADYGIENILQKYGVMDLAITKYEVAQDTVDYTDIISFSSEDIISFLHNQFEGILVEELQAFITDEKAEEFNRMNYEFYSNDENRENDEIVAERYTDMLLDFMKSCGIDISLYR